MLTGVTLSKGDPHSQKVKANLRGEASDLKLQLVDAAGGVISQADAMEFPGDGELHATFSSTAQRFRVLVTGTDSTAHPFQRMHPILFKP